MFAEMTRTFKRMASTVHHLPQSHQHKNIFFFADASTKIPQQHSCISQFSDQATGWKTIKSWLDSRTSKGLFSSLNIQSGSAPNPQSSSISRGNPFAGGKAADVWRFSLPFSAEIMNGWMKIQLYSPIRLHEVHKSHATLLLPHDNVDRVGLVSLPSRSFVSPPCCRYRLREINRKLKYARARCPAVAKRSCQTSQKREKARTVTYGDRHTSTWTQYDLIRPLLFQKKIKQIMVGRFHHFIRHEGPQGE